MSSSRRVLSVGQCGFDNSSISQFLASEFSATVDPVDSRFEALQALERQGYDLVLVNRVLDSDGSPGQLVIEAILGLDNAPPVMLVSNYADAQQQAETVGARPGFGKSALRTPETRERLRAILG
jgi:hypothetical protein